MATTRPATSDTKLRRTVGPIGLLFAAIGSIIGSGWLFGAFNASRIAGPAALFSWLIAGVMILLIALTYAELGPMFPISGGVVRYPNLVWGQFLSFSLGFVTWISTVSVPAIEVEGALTYATKFFPFTETSTYQGAEVHTLTPLGIVVAAVLLLVFIALNWFGVRLFAQINNVLVWWKLAIILLVIVAFLVTALGTTRLGSPDNFTSHGFAPQGFSGVLVAIATAGITFSFLGFRQGIELAGETTNPKRNIPFAVIGSVLITSVIYALLQVAFTLGVPQRLLSGSTAWKDLTFSNDFGPLAALATVGGLTWLAVLLYIDAVVSPADTGLIYTTIGSRVSYALGKNGNGPKWLAATNKHGVPHWSLIVTWVVGLFLLLPFPSWQQLVGFITSATVISFGVGPLVVGALRREMPERERPFKLPGGDVIPLLAFFCANMIIFWGGWATNYKLFITVLIGYVLLAVFQIAGRKSKDRPALEFRAGFWVLPWFAAMALVSFFLDPTMHPERFYWAFLTNAIITVGVYFLAMRTKLPKHKTEHLIAEAEDESAEEDAETAPAK